MCASVIALIILILLSAYFSATETAYSSLNRIKIKNLANGMAVEYTIVADSEANLKEKKIASSTPIAQGLLGHKVGDVVEIKVPSGLMKFEITKISI